MRQSDSVMVCAFQGKCHGVHWQKCVVPVPARNAFLSLVWVTCRSEQAPEPASAVRQEPRAQTDWEDLGLTVLAVFLSVVIVVILLRKLLLPSSTAPDLSMDVDVSSFD